MVSYGNTACTENFYIESLNAACGEIEGLGLYSHSCLARRTDFSSYKDNSWHHCAFVYDGMGTDFAQMWLDGELYDLFYCAQSEENEILSLEPDATGLTIGERSDGIGNYKGSLDDLFIWNRALSSTEIQILYSQTPVFGCTDELSCIYNSEADADDGSCLYVDECGECGGDGIAGCMDPYACNYDPMANCDDESCDTVLSRSRVLRYGNYLELANFGMRCIQPHRLQFRRLCRTQRSPRPFEYLRHLLR